MSKLDTCKMSKVDPNYHQVSIDLSAQLSPYSTVVGNVQIGADCSIFAGTHIRGDAGAITIGEKVNIQEGCCLHVSAGTSLTINDCVTVGHGAILHGCTIGRNSLVGMGAIVMDNAVIGENCLIGAGSLITQDKTFEPGSLIMGSPARAVRKLSEDEIFFSLTQAADRYFEVGVTMANDGLMEHPSSQANIWPEDKK